MHVIDYCYIPYTIHISITVERLYYGHPWDWPFVAVLQALEHVATRVAKYTYVVK